MTDETMWLLIGFAVGLPLVVAGWRRFDVGQVSATRDSGPAAEPCWTEATIGPDGLGYGRYCCYHADLAELDRRARVGDFQTPA
jgi:hypothetical protein